MTKHRTFILSGIAAALLPACNITAQPSALASRLPTELPYDWDLRLEFSYHALPDSYTQELRRACQDCAAVEFHQPGDEAFQLRLERGPELDALLGTLAAVPRWYERRVLFAQINHLHSPWVRFLDAGGKELLCVTVYPEGPAHARQGLSHVSLWELCRRGLPAVQQ